MDNDKNEEGETPTDSLIDSKDNEKEKINTETTKENETAVPKTEAEKNIEQPTMSDSDMKEQFRSRKKSMMSIKIEDGNITQFVEGQPITAIKE